ncbi:MAG: hypothetical protein Q4C10_11965 [Clostridia bacterium]|nr:hypothetical protein [Clostridia bacterium]
MKTEWIDGFSISVRTYNHVVTLSANKEGLFSLARQLEALAEGMPGDHIHYDEYNSLEDGSSELIVERAAQFGSDGASEASLSVPRVKAKIQP